jgi:hypothetical protein
MAQQNVHPQSATYEWPTEPDVKAKLEKWQDQKFGIIIHWGLYAVPGIMESWNLCSEEWIDRDSNIAYEDYKKWYWGQSKKFNPVNFNAEDWAKRPKRPVCVTWCLPPSTMMASICLIPNKAILKFPQDRLKTTQRLM